MLNTVNLFFNRAADHLELSEQLRTILLTPKRVVKVEIVTERDDGGLHHQLATSGNFGTVVRRNYPVAIPSRLDARTVPTSSPARASPEVEPDWAT